MNQFTNQPQEQMGIPNTQYQAQHTPVEEQQPTVVDVQMLSNQLGLNLNLIKQKVSLPIVGYLYAKMEKNPNEFAPLINLCEYLFGQEETERLFEYFQTYEELGAFLQSVMSLK